MGKREELLRLKQKYWDMGDYESVKKVRIAIKEFDAKQPKETVKPHELFDWMKEESKSQADSMIMLIN